MNYESMDKKKSLSIKEKKISWNININSKSNNFKKFDKNKIEKSNKVINDYSLLREWVLWTHSLSSNDWSIKGYKKLYVIKTVGDFWNIFNNFTKLGPDCYHIYLMKKGITPMWEDENNRTGGICSMKIDFDKSFLCYENLCSYLVTENITNNLSDINGVSFSPKINSRLSFSIIKIWNKNNKNNVINDLNKKLINKYSKLSLQYKSNIPEY